MTELIVALDGPNPRNLANHLIEIGVRWFKVGPRTLLTDRNWPDLLYPTLELRIFLDLKLADIAETCRKAVRRFADSGVAAVSTYTDAATIAALRGAKGTPLRVWRVGQLTDERNRVLSVTANMADGLIVPGIRINDQIRAAGKDIIVPGVRLDRADGGDVHLWRTAVADCVKLGATHIVIGRKIWAAEDPVAAARVYMEALK